MNIEAALSRVCEKNPWAAMWARLGEVIVQVPEGSPNCRLLRDGKLHNVWSTKNLFAPCPQDVLSLGCRGIDCKERLAWLFWDLDVGHGAEKDKYPDTETAITAARKLRDWLQGRCEIRLSKSGLGVHCTHLMPNDDHAGSEGAMLAKLIARKNNLRCDPTALGRQCRWLWTRNPQPNSFKLIAAHEGI